MISPSVPFQLCSDKLPLCLAPSPGGFYFEVAMKRCAKCGETKPRTEFYARQRNADGLGSWCKKCANDRHLVYYHAHKKEVKAYLLNWREKHPERVRAIYAKYRKKHREEMRASDRAYKKAHPETGRASCQRRKARKRTTQIEPIKDVLVFQQAGYRCVFCGRKTRPDYKPNHPLYPNLDHIIPLSKGGVHTWLNVQCLCHQCNVRKHTSIEGQQLRLLA